MRMDESEGASRRRSTYANIPAARFACRSRLTLSIRSNPASHELLIKLLKPDTSPYYETDYSVRNVARTLTLLPGHSDPEVAETVKSILQESPQVITFFIRFFKIGELDITGSTSKKKRKKSLATEHDEGLDLMINDGTGKQRTLAATENEVGIEDDVLSLIGAMSYLTSILNLPVEPAISKEVRSNENNDERNKQWDLDTNVNLPPSPPPHRTPSQHLPSYLSSFLTS